VTFVLEQVDPDVENRTEQRKEPQIARRYLPIGDSGAADRINFDATTAVQKSQPRLAQFDLVSAAWVAGRP